MDKELTIKELKKENAQLKAEISQLNGIISSVSFRDIQKKQQSAENALKQYNTLIIECKNVKSEYEKLMIEVRKNQQAYQKKYKTLVDKTIDSFF